MLGVVFYYHLICRGVFQGAKFRAELHIISVVVVVVAACCLKKQMPLYEPNIALDMGSAQI